MNRRSLMMGAAALGTTLISKRAYALFGVGDICANCATWAQQLIDYAKQAQQYLTQVSQLQTELQSYAVLVQGAVSLPQSLWANVQGDIQQVRGLANAASLLTGNAGSLMSRLNQAGGYFNSLSMTPAQLSNQFSMWQTTFGNSANSLGRVLGVSQGQEQSYTALQSAIQMHSQTAAGQLQAIQSSNEALGLMNTQLQQVHTVLVASAQEIATRDMTEAERQGRADAAWQDYVGPEGNYQLDGHPGATSALPQ